MSNFHTFEFPVTEANWDGFAKIYSQAFGGTQPDKRVWLGFSFYSGNLPIRHPNQQTQRIMIEMNVTFNTFNENFSNPFCWIAKTSNPQQAAEILCSFRDQSFWDVSFSKRAMDFILRTKSPKTFACGYAAFLLVALEALEGSKEGFLSENASMKYSRFIEVFQQIRSGNWRKNIVNSLTPAMGTWKLNDGVIIDTLLPSLIGRSYSFQFKQLLWNINSEAAEPLKLAGAPQNIINWVFSENPCPINGTRTFQAKIAAWNSFGKTAIKVYDAFAQSGIPMPVSKQLVPMDCANWLVTLPSKLRELSEENYQFFMSTIISILDNWEPRYSRMGLLQIPVELRLKSYGEVPEDLQKFARECAKWDIAPFHYKTLATEWRDSQSVPPLFPNIISVACGDLIGKFMPRNDPRGLFLGEYTDCCQHPNGEGSKCAEHGQTSPDGGFFVIFSKNGTIRAQSWVWRDKEGRGYCFDNIETNALSFEEKYFAQVIYLGAAESIVEDSAENGFADCIVTTGKNTDLEIGIETDHILTPDYSGYRDSKKQRLLAATGFTIPENMRNTFEDQYEDDEDDDYEDDFDDDDE